MKVVDMHCDTILELYAKKQKGEAVSIAENDLHIDLSKMEKGDYLVQNFAIFTPLEEIKGIMSPPGFNLFFGFLEALRISVPKRGGGCRGREAGHQEQAFLENFTIPVFPMSPPAKF